MPRYPPKYESIFLIYHVEFSSDSNDITSISFLKN